VARRRQPWGGVTCSVDPIVGKTAAANHGKIRPAGAGNLTVSAKSIGVMAFLIIAPATAGHATCLG
jgi:hypothetical protein